MKRSQLAGLCVLTVAAGIGAGFYPGWRLEEELRQAGCDGLATVAPQPPVVPDFQNAKPGMAQAMHRHPRAVRSFVMNPLTSDPEVEALAQELVVVAAQRPKYWTDASGYDEDVVAGLARYAARRARDGGELDRAARLAGTLNGLRDSAGQILWAKAADGVLDAADRLRLAPDVRNTVITALGTPVDPRERMRHHMIEILGQQPGWTPTASWTDRFRAFRQGKEFRYIAAWRTFWQRASPRDDAGFAAILAQDEHALRDLESSMGRHTQMPAVFGATRNAWSQWYARLAGVRKRMQD